MYLIDIPRSKRNIKYITSTKKKLTKILTINKTTFYLNKKHIESLRSD